MEVTLLTENTRVRYTGDGVLKEFSYPFNPIDLSYVKVYKNLQPVTAPDVTISSGVVTFNTAPAEGDSIVIIREKPLTYDSGIVSKGIISPDSLDNLAVELLGQIQQVNEKLDRVPVYPIDTTMTGKEILNQFNQNVSDVRDAKISIEGKVEEINTIVSSGLTEITEATSESKTQITEEKNNSINEIQRVTEGLVERAETAADESELWASEAEKFANQADLDSIRTNCLTVIPQDIKLSYENGTVKVGAGKVYDGAGNVININREISRAITPDVQLMLFVSLDGNSIAYCAATFQAFSGDTAPSTSQTSYTWYDTTEKRVKAFTNSVYSADFSLPIGLLDVDGTVTTFNVYGTIGKTFFLLPNREGLISNGKNTDGGFNNVKFKTTELQTWNAYVGDGELRTFTLYWNNETSKFDLGEFDVINDVMVSRYYIQKEVPSTTSHQLWYNPDTGVWKCRKFNGWKNCLPVVFFSSVVQNERIISFQQKNVFQAPDYQDVPKLATDNTFSGINTFDKTIYTNIKGAILSNDFDDNQDITPSVLTGGMIFLNKSKTSAAGHDGVNSWIFGSRTPDGSNTTGIAVRKYVNGVERSSHLSCVVFADGNAYAYCPTPAVHFNGTEIATTQWFNQKIQVVSTLPANPNANVYYFIPE